MVVEKELKEKTKLIYRNLLNKLSFNGDEHCINMGVAIIYRTFMDGETVGEYYAPGTKEVNDYIEINRSKLSNKRINEITNCGLIALDRDLLFNDNETSLYTRFFHEFIHSTRLVMTNIGRKTTSDEDPFIYHNGRYIENSDNGIHFCEASKVLRGSIDTSRVAKGEFSELEGFLFSEEYGRQLDFQEHVNEALVEIVTQLAFRQWIHKNEDLMDSIRKLQNHHDFHIKSMVNIILRHNDLELIKWTINPLYYQNFDLTYDYFGKYINNDDLHDVETFYYEKEEEYKGKVKRR